MKKLAIHYFSGTGNTYHAVRLMGREFENSAIDVHYINMENSHSINISDYDIHVFAFPVYAFAVPAIAIRYMKCLSLNKDWKAAIICIHGDYNNIPGYDGQALNQSARLLKRKGCDVFFVDSAGYPESFTMAVNPPNEEYQKIIVDASDKKVIEFAGQIMAMKRTIKKCGILNHIWSWLVWVLFAFIGRRFLGKCYFADEGCSSCGKCTKVCPVSAIKLSKGKPKWNYSCEGCQRCINSCPQNSIQVSLLRLMFYSLGFFMIPVQFSSFILKSASIDSPYIGLFSYVSGLAAYLLIAIVFDFFLTILEQCPGIKKIFTYTYTRKFRRYLASGFNPLTNRDRHDDPANL